MVLADAMKHIIKDMVKNFIIWKYKCMLNILNKFKK